MSIVRKVKAVEKLYAHLAEEIEELKAGTGLKCITGCGACCIKPELEATPLEFLPLAFHLYLTGQAYSRLEWLEQHPGGNCHVFRFGTEGYKSGSCTEYEHRGLICRLFGFAAVRDKNGQKQLSTCQILKTQTPTEVGAARNWIAAGNTIPVYSQYYSKLQNIDPSLGSKPLPVNEAIREAIEAVLHHYAYRKPPRRLKRAA